MLDRDLAELYGVTTGRLNEQVKRNRDRFPEDFMFELSKEEFAKIRKDAGAVGVVSLSRKWFETDSNKDVREIDVIRDPRQENPLSELQRLDLKVLLTKGLSRAERLIVILYYYEEMTMKEIGMTLDLSESRVSQMHSSILARLKAQMQHRDKEF